MIGASTFRLLLVEDNPGDVHLARTQLTDVPDFAFEVFYAARLRDAIEIVRRMRIDGIILDLNLPDSSGIDSLRTLRAASEDIAIVVLSGSEGIELRNQAFAEGAYDFICKTEPSAKLLARSVLYALERHRAQALHRQIEKLVSASPDAVLVVDKTNIVRFVNRAAEELFGVDGKTLLGDHLGFSIRENEPHDIEILRKGEIRTAEIRVAEIDWVGMPGSLVSVRDVTDHRHLTEQLRQAQKMEAVGLLAGGIAHDFNNLLVIMMGCADLISDGMRSRGAPGATGGTLWNVVEELQQATERAKALTMQLLVFSGQRPSQPRPIDMNEATLSMYKLIRRTLPEHIEISVLPHDGLWPVMIDPGQLGQVILNLAVNARDAMNNGGRLTIALENSHHPPSSGTLPPSDYVVMRVSDTGMGIARFDFEHIFDPFFTTKEAGKGTGLGLATCRSIIRQARGDILVDSTLGAGTIFSIYLPRTFGDVVQLTQNTRDPTQHRGWETVLVVEDDPAVARLTAIVLRNHGYQVLTARNGLDARRAIEGGQTMIHLVLTDVVMPQMGGLELADHLEAEHPEIALLLMSGYSEDLLQHDPVYGRAKQILHKPFLPQELLARVRATLDEMGPIRAPV